MKFTVIWMPAPEARLLDFWLRATDRKQVEEAANWIDRHLRNDPLQKVTRVDDLYFLRRDPLTVLCQISVDDRIVSVIDVHRRVV
jgi:mRNA-degrading endonuclease RelE of RelBE toxin-antitoxin system